MRKSAYVVDRKDDPVKIVAGGTATEVKALAATSEDYVAIGGKPTLIERLSGPEMVSLHTGIVDLLDLDPELKIGRFRSKEIGAEAILTLLKGAPEDTFQNASDVEGITPDAGIPKTPESDGPVGQVWAICDKFPDLARKEQVKKCVDAGLKPGTAGTQVSRWRKANGKARTPASPDAPSPDAPSQEEGTE